MILSRYDDCIRHRKVVVPRQEGKILKGQSTSKNFSPKEEQKQLQVVKKQQTNESHLLIEANARSLK